METFRHNIFVVTVAAAVAGILAVSVAAVGAAIKTPAAETSEPVTYSEPSWTDTSTLIVGGYETPSPEMIATAPPLSQQ